MKIERFAHGSLPRGIGGSSIGTILGLGKPGDEWKLWMQLTGLVEPSPDAPHFVAGRILEAAVADWWQQLGPCADSIGRLEKPETLLIDDWFRVSADRAVYLHAGDRQGLECKTARSPNESQESDWQWGESGSDVVPLKYQIQCQSYMFGYDLSEWYLCVFFKWTNEFRWYKLQRKQNVIDHMLAVGKAWWDKHVVGAEPPAIDASGAAADWLYQQYPTAGETMIDVEKEQGLLLEHYQLLTDQKKRIEEKQASIKNELIALIGGNQGLICRDIGYKAVYPNRATSSLDTKALKNDYPEIYEKYLRKGETRAFSVKPLKSED